MDLSMSESNLDIIEEHGGFQAFNQDEFDEKADKLIDYVPMQMSVYVPKDKLQTIVTEIMNRAKTDNPPKETKNICQTQSKE